MTQMIERRLTLNLPISRVWEALTDSRQFGEWFGVRLEAPFRPQQAISGNITNPGYEHIQWQAVVQDMAPEHLFSFTWHPYAIDPAVDYSGESPTLVEFRLEEAKDGTQLLFRETGFEKLPDFRREEAFKMHEQGWTQQMQNITQYLMQPSA
jgi:uncharacterized protein YndB with AHSA1/START domain